MKCSSHRGLDRPLGLRCVSTHVSPQCVSQRSLFRNLPSHVCCGPLPPSVTSFFALASASGVGFASRRSNGRHAVVTCLPAGREQVSAGACSQRLCTRGNNMFPECRHMVTSVTCKHAVPWRKLRYSFLGRPSSARRRGHRSCVPPRRFGISHASPDVTPCEPDGSSFSVPGPGFRGVVGVEDAISGRSTLRRRAGLFRSCFPRASRHVPRGALVVGPCCPPPRDSPPPPPHPTAPAMWRGTPVADGAGPVRQQCSAANAPTAGRLFVPL